MSRPIPIPGGEPIDDHVPPDPAPSEDLAVDDALRVRGLVVSHFLRLLQRHLGDPGWRGVRYRLTGPGPRAAIAALCRAVQRDLERQLDDLVRDFRVDRPLRVRVRPGRRSTAGRPADTFEA